MKKKTWTKTRKLYVAADVHNTLEHYNLDFSMIIKTAAHIGTFKG